MNKRLVSLILVVAMASASVSAFAADKAKKDDGKKTTQAAPAAKDTKKDTKKDAKKADTTKYAAPWMAVYNKAGDINLSVGVGNVGWYYGVGASFGAEYVIGAFDIANIPLQYGIRLQGNAGFDLYWNDIYWSAAPQAVLHFGTKFNGYKLDWYGAAGFGAYGYDGYGPYWRFSESEGVTWFLNDKTALTLDATYTGYYSETIGVSFKF
jgi:hypothetical protein